MNEEKNIAAPGKEEPGAGTPKPEMAELKKTRRIKPVQTAALFLTVFILIAVIYAFANGHLQASFAQPAKRAEELKKQTEDLQAQMAEILRQKETLERRRSEILEQLEKTKALVEKSKNASAAVDAHLEVLSSSCLSCPPPAWVESYKTAFAALEEIERILDEDKPGAPAK